MTNNNHPPQKRSSDKPGCDSKSCSGCGLKSGCSMADSSSESNKTVGEGFFVTEQTSIARTIVVLSGKGGVGKSTVAVNLASSLASQGLRVGLLDIDLHGPSIPTMMKLQQTSVQSIDNRLMPAERGGIKVMSVGLLLKKKDDALIWRGPMKAGVIEQLLHEVAWGTLDYLVVDSPPGTGDEPLSICQTIKTPFAAVIVTTPQEVAAADVRKSISFCRQLKINILGIIENMSGFICPDCEKEYPIFGSGGGAKISQEFNLNYLGNIPIDPNIGTCSDSGHMFVYDYGKTPTGKAFARILDQVLKIAEEQIPTQQVPGPAAE
ncbi:MAG: P-loop NTPase [Candidatus Rifleibacteriota bacterium]